MSSVLKLKTENITPSLRGTGLCKYGEIYVYVFLGKVGPFEEVQTFPSRRTVYYSTCTFLTANLQAVIRLHASPQKKSLLPAVTLRIRDKEQSSNQLVSCFTTERSLLPLRSVQPERRDSSPFCLKVLSRSGTEQDLSSVFSPSPTASQNTSDYSFQSK